jgi:hypothetical protein
MNQIIKGKYLFRFTVMIHLLLKAIAISWDVIIMYLDYYPHMHNLKFCVDFFTNFLIDI